MFNNWKKQLHTGQGLNGNILGYVIMNVWWDMGFEV